MECRPHAPGGGERRGRGVARTAAAISSRPQQTPDLGSTAAQSHSSLLHSAVCTDNTSWHAGEQETLSLPISSRRHRLLRDGRQPAGMFGVDARW